MNVKKGHQGQKNVLITADTPLVRKNGMRSLQTACSSSGRAHFVAAMGFSGVIRQFYASGKISTCCLLLAFKLGRDFCTMHLTTKFDIRLHCRHIQTVQSYLAGCANVHPI